MGQPSGMIVDEVLAMAAQLSAAADQIRQLTNTLNVQVQQATWWGADHDRFVTDFNNQVPSLFAIADALSGFANRANTNAQEQISISNQG